MNIHSRIRHIEYVVQLAMISEIAQEKDSDNMADVMPRKMDFIGAIRFAVMK